MFFCPSVRPSTFFISLISRKVLPLRKKIIVEIGFKNCKELSYKKFLKNNKSYYLKKEENYYCHFPKTVGNHA